MSNVLHLTNQLIQLATNERQECTDCDTHTSKSPAVWLVVRAKDGTSYGQLYLCASCVILGKSAGFRYWLPNGTEV